MRISWAVWDIFWEDKEANFKVVREFALQAKKQEAELMVLPEMFATGFTVAVDRVGEEVNAKTYPFLKNLAIDTKIAILGGFAERQGDRVYNVVYLFDADGSVTGPYAKIHPFRYGGEAERFTGGENLLVFPFRDFIICPLICYDLRFPELFLAAVNMNAELFIIPANWPSQRKGHWKTLLKARAIETQSFVLGVNRIGSAEGIDYNGDSMLIAPDGSVLFKSGNIAGLFTVEIDRELLDTWRSRFPALMDKRPEVYRNLGVWI